MIMTADFPYDWFDVADKAFSATESAILKRSQAMAEHLSVPGKTVLLEEGKVADKLYMIRKGCLRLSFFNDGRDITFQFFFEGDVVASFNSLHHRQPSLFSLETLEPAELSVI